MDETTAIHIVALHVLARVAETVDDDEWENYPDVGENDWERIQDEAKRMRPQYPNATDYDAAYKFLSGRAETGLT